MAKGLKKALAKFSDRSGSYFFAAATGGIHDGCQTFTWRAMWTLSLWKCAVFQKRFPLHMDRSRMCLNSGASRDFGLWTEFGATWKQPIIPGNSRECSWAGEEDQVTWLDLQPGYFHVFLLIINLYQHAFNIKYLANLINILNMFPPSQTDKLSSVLPTQHPRAGLAAANLENLLEDPT